MAWFCTKVGLGTYHRRHTCRHSAKQGVCLWSHTHMHCWVTHESSPWQVQSFRMRGWLCTQVGLHTHHRRHTCRHSAKQRVCLWPHTHMHCWVTHNSSPWQVQSSRMRGWLCTQVGPNTFITECTHVDTRLSKVFANGHTPTCIVM
jgi:hypothetical protein